MNIQENIRKIMSKLKKMNDKEKIFNIIFICLLGIAMVFASNFFTKTIQEEPIEDSTELQQTFNTDAYLDYQSKLEKQLENILGQIESVGRVDVMITFNNIEQKQIAYNTTETSSTTKENDNQGGERITEQNSTDQNAIMVNSNGNNSPLIITENYPDIKGIIIVAEGASDPQIKYQLMKGVEYSLDLPSYKIMVYAKQK